MALALLAMNQVFGKFFDVLDVEAAESQAVHALKGNIPPSSLMCRRITSVRPSARLEGRPARVAPPR